MSAEPLHLDDRYTPPVGAEPGALACRHRVEQAGPPVQEHAVHACRRWHLANAVT
jgi:hypothetical protein